MKAIFYRKYFVMTLLCGLMMGCASTRHGHGRSSSVLRADHVITVADDFVVDVYLNGVRVPDDKRTLLAEIFGATVERINAQVHKGDWLVFHAVNNRLRWGGSYYFAAAGVLQSKEFGFVSETESGNWSACDDPAKGRRFIEKKWYLHQDKAQPISRIWQDGTPQMKRFAGDSWDGEPLWGMSRDTWLKVIVR
jgi:hypothetical protein